MSRVLVVEDDRAIADLVALYLRHDGHDVNLVADGLDALSAVETAPTAYDLVILDLMLPGLDGRGVCRRLRDISPVPIIMLTALDDDRDKIEGLELGADDYLTKPFNPKELVARVHAVLRRSSRQPNAERRTPSAIIPIGNAHLDLDTRRLTLNDQDIPLRTKEFDLLATLAARPGIAFTREQLLDRVWDPDVAGDTRTVDVHISRLREKLAAAHITATIDTIRSIGYRLSQ
jgi:DNA-binding response OmpR family regulator